MSYAILSSYGMRFYCNILSGLLLAVTVVAHDAGYHTSLANHIRRWLADENIVSQVVTPAQMAGALAKEKIVFLVGFTNPSTSEMKTLASFKARGGKMVVFHSSSSTLGELMGVKPIGYRAAVYTGEFWRMNFSEGQSPPGLPASIQQSSAALHRARPIAGRSRVLAMWHDRAGKSTGEPAWLASASGYWMTHVLLSDGDERLKAQLLGALVGSAQPQLWNIAAHNARTSARQAAFRAYATKQVPRRGEIHAVWDHTGCGLYPGDWPRTMRVLQSSRVTDLFVNVAGAGFAHYQSAVLPRSKTFMQNGDQLAACLAAARGTGIRVHAWVLCFSATRSGTETLEAYRKRGWRLKDTQGKLTEYLNPANQAVRAQVLSAIDEIQTRYAAISGIHLDFVRWGDSTVKPKGAAWAVTQFVSEARRRVKQPRWLTAAVYGKHPECVTSVGQDWPTWLSARTVDYVVPMDYTESSEKFTELLKRQAALKDMAPRIIIGIGVTANESRLNARQVIDQIRLTRQFNFAGQSMFDLDTTLEKEILPYLRLGIW